MTIYRVKITPKLLVLLLPQYVLLAGGGSDLLALPSSAPTSSGGYGAHGALGPGFSYSGRFGSASSCRSGAIAKWKSSVDVEENEKIELSECLLSR